MEIVDIYDKCPGKGRLDELKENVESLRRRVDHERAETQGEIKMVEETIAKVTESLNSVTAGLAKLGFKIVVGLLGIFASTTISLIVYIYFSNLK